MELARRIALAGMVAAITSTAFAAQTYYVKPGGNDGNAGTTTGTAWATLNKVNTTSFNPGDQILFERGGEWRESLNASSSGTSADPIVYDAYGSGAKPRFYGSDILVNASFTSAGGNNYTYSLATQADYALEDGVFIPSTYGGGTLTITATTNPATNGKLYTACVRGNTVYSNYRNHLVFRNIVADETAGQMGDGNVQGYGFRIQGSTNVLVEDCEAHRAGRHNFGVINATQFVGRRLNAEYVAPNVPDENTIYVSYADAGAPVASCTSEWIDCTADHLENGRGGEYHVFTSHGDNQGSILFDNFTIRSKASIMSAPLEVRGGTLLQSASLEIWGDAALIDGVTFLDNTAVDIYSDDCIVQNCLFDMTLSGGGPTGYASAVLCRSGAERTKVRFNTIVSGAAKGLVMVDPNSQTQFYGNIVMGSPKVIALWNGTTITSSDLALCDYNFYNASPTFQVAWADRSFAEWQGFGFDANSQTGDPAFTNAGSGDYSLAAGSTAVNAALVSAGNVPATDFDGAARPAGAAADIGAFERDGTAPGASPSITSASTAGGTVGTPFSYQIVATETPTSYNATGLPAGLSVNTGTGLIDGTPSVAAVSTVSLTATNATGTGSLTLTITIADVAGPTTYALTVVNGTGSGSYEAGHVQSIVASAPATGYVFDEWVGDTAHVSDAFAATSSVTMPATAVSLTATYVSTDPDTDGDGLTDAEEALLSTNPNNPDTDGDLMPDGWENENLLDPLVDDAADDEDGDGYTNYQEMQWGSDPQLASSIPDISDGTSGCSAHSTPGSSRTAAWMALGLVWLLCRSRQKSPSLYSVRHRA